jgi:hypothetical protein
LLFKKCSDEDKREESGNRSAAETKFDNDDPHPEIAAAYPESGKIEVSVWIYAIT